LSWLSYKLLASATVTSGTTFNYRRIRQPGDGNRLFHSIGAAVERDAGSLRQEIASRAIDLSELASPSKKEHLIMQLTALGFDSIRSYRDYIRVDGHFGDALTI
jgi:hypothetical protein